MKCRFLFFADNGLEVPLNSNIVNHRKLGFNPVEVVFLPNQEMFNQFSSARISGFKADLHSTSIPFNRINL